MPSYTKFKGVTDVSQSTFNDNLESNLIEFCNWSMLCIGGFGTAQYGSASGAYGGDLSRLHPVNDRDFMDGQVWEGPRQDWIWESGIEYPVQPIQVSGIWINGTFYPGSTTGTYAHTVDYPDGRIVFATPLPTDGSVIVNTSYSYRLWTFQSSDETWFRQIMFESFRVERPDVTQYGSGVWNILAEDRVQLPAVVVEITPNRRIFGFELGGTSTYHQDVVFHIFTESPYDRKSMIDYLTYQRDKTIPLFDKNLMIAANAFSLNPDGTIASGAKCFPDLVQPTGQGGFFWKPLTFVQMGSQASISTPPLYQAAVRATVEVNLLVL